MTEMILRASRVDQRLLLAVLHRRGRWADLLMRRVTMLGNWYVVAPMTLLLALGFVPFLAGPGQLAAWSLALSHLVVQFLKRTISRPRPTLPVGLRSMIEPEDRFSFPSGHAAAGLSVGLPLALALGGVAGAVALGMGLLVGVSRCYLGVHYPGDVVMGWILATGTVAAVMTVFAL